MSKTSITTHVGGIRCQTSFDSSDAAFATDVETAMGGRGELPSPGDMLAATVASCMLSMIAYTGAQKGFGTEGVTARSCYESGKGGITALVFDISVPMQTTLHQRRFIEAAAEQCPVGAAIAPHVEKRITWHWAE